MSLFTVPFFDVTIQDVQFSAENLPLLLAVIAAVLILHFLVIKRSQKRAVTFSNYEVLEKLVGKEQVENRNVVPLLLRTLVLVLILVAISNFQVTLQGFSSNTDFVFALDTSASMLNPDVQPSRLAAAKDAATTLLDDAPEGINIGIVTFGGGATVALPPTKDQQLVRSTLPNITFSERGGTAIGDAIIQSATEMEQFSGNKSVLLITDGSNNIGVSINESLVYVEGRNITIHTVGIGSAVNESNQSVDIPEELQSENATVTVASSGGYDAGTLRFLANATGGTFHAASNRSALQDIYRSTVLSEAHVEIEPMKYLLIVAAFLLILEWGLGATKYKTLP